MKLTKLPDSCDPNLLIKERSRKIFSVCPCCGESKNYHLLENNGGVERIEYVNPNGWYGPAKGYWIGLLFPNRWYHWRIDNYKCHSCGAEWESDPYPIDVGDKCLN